jgi:hypothetical protein
MFVAPGTKLFVLGYYNMAGTGIAPKVCGNIFDEALTIVNKAINDGLAEAGVPSRFVGNKRRLSHNVSLLQAWYRIFDLANQLLSHAPPGWPHPNDAGHIAIGEYVGELITQ